MAAFSKETDEQREARLNRMFNDRFRWYRTRIIYGMQDALSPGTLEMAVLLGAVILMAFVGHRWR